MKNRANRVYNFVLIGVMVVLGGICLTGCCNTIRGFALDLEGMSEGSAKQIDAPNRLAADRHDGQGYREDKVVSR